MKERSLKNKLFFYIVTACIIVILIFSVMVFVMADGMLKDSQLRDQRMIIENQIRLLDSNISQVMELIQWINLNQNLLSILERPPENAYEFDAARRDFNADLEREIAAFSEYISAVFIMGENGFLVRKGFNSYTIEPENYMNEAWYSQSLDSNGELLWWPIRENYTHIPASIKAEEYNNIVKVYKKINHPTNYRFLGGVVLFFCPSLFFGESNEEYYNKENRFFIINSDGSVILDDSMEPVSGSIAQIDQDGDILQAVSRLNKLKSNSTQVIQKDGKFIFIRMSSVANLYLVRITEQKPLWIASGNFFYSILAVVIMLLALSLIFSTFLSRTFTKPIARIVKKIHHIADGDFGYQADEKFSGELLFLNNNLLKMESDIQQIMRENAEKEKEKRSLELQVLQMQIRPHFLYNTLNSIRWMATFQGMKGIETMVTSLGIVIMEAYKEKNEKIPLSEELYIIEHYYNIQKIRYKDKISMETLCTDSSLMRSLIPRFTLQPIVENAIFHGIEKKQSVGTLRITVEEQQNTVCINIWDDGVGIDSDRLSHILDAGTVHLHSGLNGIGLANVHSRIRLICGEEYGLRVQSEKGVFTVVTVRIPKEYALDREVLHENTDS